MNKIILSGWLQLKIKRIDIEKNLYIFEDYKDKTKEIIVAIDSFRVQEKNTFVKEEEMNWRNSELKIGDKLDFLNKKKYWAEATIKKIISENEISIETLGQPPTDEIIVNKYSPFVQPYLKYSIKYEPEYINSVNALHDNISFQRFNYVVPFTENNHLVPFDNTKFYSIEYYELTNFFINKVIETKILMNESISIEYIYMILNVLYVTLPAINHKFLGEYIEKNCLENIEKILLKLSLDKKMNKSKFVVEEIIKYLKIFYGLDHYLFQVTEYFLEFCLEFGFNCFKISENLEKRLLGLNSIFKIIGMASIDFLGYSNDQMDKVKLLIKNKLFGNEENNDLFGLLFTNPNIHDQLLLKGTEVIMLLAKIKLIDDKIVERLYNYSWRVEDDSEIHKSIFIILGDCATLMELSQQKILFDKIISLPHDKIRQKDISLISYVLRAIIDENEFKIMCEAFLDYYYKYILEYQKSNDSSYSQFALVLSYAKSEENIKYFFCHYFEKIVNDSKIQNNLDDYRYIFYFIYSIINILKEKEQKEKNITYIPAIKNQFREIFLKVYKNMEEIVDKLMDLNTKDTLDEESKELNITDIIHITAKLIEFIEQKNFYSLESMKKLSEYYIFSNILRKTRNIFLIKLSGFQLYNLDKEKFFDYFFNRFNSFLDTINETNPENNKLLDDIIILNVFHIYLNLNRHSEEELPEDIDLNNYLKSLKVYTAKDNPLKYKYIDIIWKMFSKYKYCIELSQFIETFSLKNFSPSERHEIWEKLVEKIFQNIDNNTLISLQMIELIINNSEKFGSGNTKSHSIELKKKVPVKLYLHNDLSKLLPEFDFSETEEIFYSTDIIYDIKKRIQKNMV